MINPASPRGEPTLPPGKPPHNGRGGAPVRIAVDTGGTFTDIAVSDSEGRLWVDKALTSHPDVFDGVAAALEAVAAQIGNDVAGLLARCDVFTYATTHATNAILTGATARTAFLTTAGFPDTLLLREGGKFGVFDHGRAYPDPYVPRRLTFEVPERVTAEGAIQIPLEQGALRELCSQLGELGIEAVGVCLLWSFVEPAHECAVGAALAEYLPGVAYTLSHELNPVIREYRRASAACIDASLKPLMSRHLATVRQRLRDAGLGGSLLVVTSTGGVAPIEDVEERPILVVNSGPAIAPVGAAAAARSEDLRGDAIVCDMGGTTFDVSLLRDGEVGFTRETWLGGRFTGHLTGLSSVAVESIGYGGGSIAWIDDGGLLRVGPQSAGSDPGPACYGLGGTRPTVTDAAVVLGYIDPSGFLGGRIPLDRDAAVGAVLREVGEPLGLGAEPAAAAIMELAMASMAHAVEAVTVEQGLDPRGATLIGGGGAAGLCLAAIGRELSCGQVLMPATAAVLSASGGLHSDLVADVSASHLTDTRVMDVAAVERMLCRLDAELARFRDRVGRKDAALVREFTVEARYRFQVWDLEVPLPMPSDSDRPLIDPVAIEAGFHSVHERLFGVREEGQTVECVAWRGRGRVSLEPPRSFRAPAPDDARVQARTTAPAYFSELGSVPTPRFDGTRLQAGAALDGPAIVELPATTIVVYPGCRAQATEHGHLLITTAAETWS